MRARFVLPPILFAACCGLSDAARGDEAASTGDTYVGRLESRLSNAEARFENRIGHLWNEGEGRWYLPAYTWHLPSAYPPEKRDSYNHMPTGLGYGHAIYDAKGDAYDLYAMVFQDSHFKPEYAAGVAWKTFWPLGGDFKAGLGYTVGFTGRADIARYLPVPMALPLASIEYKQRYSLETVYVPGGKGFGNVMLFWLKARF